MKINEVKRLAETHSRAELQAAAECIEAGQEPEIAVSGDDEGEQLTHCLGGVFVCEACEAGKTMKDALREFAQRVRGSMSSKG
jgi:hypothetical protein